MAFMMLVSECFGCGHMFSSNPDLVPSVRVKDGKLSPDGTREPLCQNCVKVINATRKARGLDELTVLPGAYEAAEV